MRSLDLKLSVCALGVVAIAIYHQDISEEFKRMNSLLGISTSAESQGTTLDHSPVGLQSKMGKVEYLELEWEDPATRSQVSSILKGTIPSSYEEDVKRGKLSVGSERWTVAFNIDRTLKLLKEDTKELAIANLEGDAKESRLLKYSVDKHVRNLKGYKEEYLKAVSNWNKELLAPAKTDEEIEHGKKIEMYSDCVHGEDFGLVAKYVNYDYLMYNGYQSHRKIYPAVNTFKHLHCASMVDKKFGTELVTIEDSSSIFFGDSITITTYPANFKSNNNEKLSGAYIYVLDEKPIEVNGKIFPALELESDGDAITSETLAAFGVLSVLEYNDNE